MWDHVCPVAICAASWDAAAALLQCERSCGPPAGACGCLELLNARHPTKATYQASLSMPEACTIRGEPLTWMAAVMMPQSAICADKIALP